jgi:hypothetical protein
VGASKGTRWHAAATRDRQIALNAAILGKRVRAIFKILSILAP